MAEPFKNLMGPPAIERLAALLSKTGPFDTPSFVAACLGPLESLELKDRVRHVASCLRAHLDPEYPDALTRILRSLPPAMEGTEGTPAGIEMWPLCHFVEEFGLDHPDRSIEAMHELTRRFSCEFTIRPYLDTRPVETMAVLAEWVSDPDPHVRRLVSEGTRPRLPWGMRLQRFVQDPGPVVALLERLKDDPEDYVRRSVANNLNDIAKDHPGLVVLTARRWLENASPERRKLVKHALRTLLKAGHPEALALFGFEETTTACRLWVATPEVSLGADLVFAVELESERGGELLVDYAIHHQKANGKLSPKVFKWTTRSLAPGETVRIERAHSMRPVTTRVYYPGAHRVEIRVNGSPLAIADFVLLEP